MKIVFSSQRREMLLFLTNMAARDVTCEPAIGLRWQEAQLKIETFAQICFENNFIRKRHIHTTKHGTRGTNYLVCNTTF